MIKSLNCMKRPGFCTFDITPVETVRLRLGTIRSLIIVGLFFRLSARTSALGGPTRNHAGHTCCMIGRINTKFGERNERLPDLCFLICRFPQVVFIHQAQPHAQSLFLFPIVFGINLIHFFDFFDEKEERCSRKFDRLLCCFDPLSITPFDSAKNANCFEKCNVFGNGKCELSAIQERRN